MCSVVGCDSWRRSAHRFKLPEDPERRLEWVQFILEANGQRLKESSWTDITICKEHFTDDCFVKRTPASTVQLQSNAAPSVCVNTEPDEPLESPQYVDPEKTASQCDQLRPCGRPSSYSEESTAAQESPALSVASEAFMSDYGQMLQNIVNIDMIRKKAALLQMKGKYVVHEKRLLQLFSHKCPSCGAEVKTEKVTYGVLIILNQQCLQCDYRYQWKSQVNARVPAAGDQQLTEVVDVDANPESQQILLTDNCSTEESDPMDETEESGDEGSIDSDEDWNPVEEHFLTNELFEESEEETEDEEEEDGVSPPLALKHSQLCTECGTFFNKQKHHTCEHKIKPYPCNICGKRCVSEVALNTHSRIHDENYEHRCKYCHVTFKTKMDKITHQQIHFTEGKPYKCPDCPEIFATNKERRIHLEDHRGPRQLKCQICAIDFTHITSLRRHLAVHTGEKPYKCLVCQRGFSQAGHLKSHMRLHTGEQPFKCRHCDKSFNHNVSLKSHVQRVHSSSSGRERKKGKKRKSVVDTCDAQENGNKRGTDSGLDNVEKEHDEEEEVQKEETYVPKHKKRSTGRPIGRPKRNEAEEMKGQSSNTKTAKVKVRKLKRTQCNVTQESEDEPSESNMSFDATEEEENRKKVTSSTTRARGRAKHSDGDSEFEPEERKKKTCSRQNSGTSSRKLRARRGKN